MSLITERDSVPKKTLRDLRPIVARYLEPQGD
jgi:hypothetical protein